MKAWPWCDPSGQAETGMLGSCCSMVQLPLLHVRAANLIAKAIFDIQAIETLFVRSEMPGGVCIRRGPKRPATHQLVSCQGVLQNPRLEHLVCMIRCQRECGRPGVEWAA